MTRLSSYKNALKLGIGIFSFGLVISFITALSVNNQNNTIITQSLETVTEQVANNIIDRIVLYQYGLRGARGVIYTVGEDNISRDFFKKYSLTRDFESEFPGARGFGYIRRVPANDEASFVAKAKLDDWPDFSVRQLTPHDDERYVIDYIEPVDRNLAAVGLDISSEQNRKNAAQQAYLTGETRLTGPITLVQATGHPLQAFLILMPIYRTGLTPATPALREQQAFGWSYAPLVANEVFEQINLSRKTTKLLVNDVTDAQNNVMFYETHIDEVNPLTSFVVTLDREIFGRKWQVTLVAYPEFVSSLHLISPNIVFSYGAIVSLLLGGLIGFYGYDLGRKRIILEDNERRANILEHSLDAIISFDCDGIITSWNDGAVTMFGYEKHEVIGLEKTTFIVPDDGYYAENERFNQVVNGKSLLNFVSQYKRKDNVLLSTSMTSLAIYNEFGKIIGVSQTIRDITAQQNAEKQILDINASLERKVTERTQALQQALSENKTLLDNINQQLLYSETDKDGVILMVNDNFCLTSGFTRE
ncbi:CHASE domain-containing protein, partial [Shewanella sp. SG41-4]|uniref:CHASE domain-containing protein n=1 Tax=Shewanella sp. SG41-4 TaxID=2760976 RepID=UPI0021759E59